MSLTLIVVSVLILTGNVIQYLLHSRCKKIKCGNCCEIERSVVNEDKINNNNEINIKDL